MMLCLTIGMSFFINNFKQVFARVKLINMVFRNTSQFNVTCRVVMLADVCWFMLLKFPCF